MALRLRLSDERKEICLRIGHREGSTDLGLLLLLLWLLLLLELRLWLRRMLKSKSVVVVHLGLELETKLRLWTTVLLLQLLLRLLLRLHSQLGLEQILTSRLDLLHCLEVRWRSLAALLARYELGMRLKLLCVLLRRSCLILRRLNRALGCDNRPLRQVLVDINCGKKLSRTALLLVGRHRKQYHTATLRRSALKLSLKDGSL